MENWTFKDIAKSAHDILTYPIFSIDNQGFSLSTLLTGIVLLAVGYWACKRLSRAVEERFLTRLHMDDSLRYTLSRAIFYLFVIFWSLFTLRLLSVPLTIFTVLGGALAVGIGFGSQNLVSNFISGLMVMIERPMHVGDYIEVNGVKGFVERIGIRATHLKTTSNVRIIIPNKTFLEEFLTNFSQSGGMVQSKFSLGVAYGTDVDKMVALVLEVLKSESQTLESPAPGVFLVDFADNCLQFEVISWINTNFVTDVYGYQSNVRLRINSVFEEHKISIPFPQRDVRMEVVSPVPVQMVERN